MFSKRFNKTIQISRHAQFRALERKVSDEYIVDIIEYGKIKIKDKKRLWLYHSFTNRDDNFLCLAVVMEDVLVVKTVMINWELKEI